jgi:hypothetical protein
MHISARPRRQPVLREIAPNSAILREKLRINCVQDAARLEVAGAAQSKLAREIASRNLVAGGRTKSGRPKRMNRERFRRRLAARLRWLRRGKLYGG